MGEAVFTEVEIPRFVAVERSAKNEPEKLQMLFERTGLEDFNLTILRSNSENFEKKLSDEELIRESSRVVVIKGGWCSDRKILEDLAADILERDPKAVVLMIDHAGQRDSGFKNPEIITTDEHKETLEFNLEATKVGMELLGFSDEQILKLNKNLVKIGHSRGAAAGLYDKEALENPDIKY
jgi:glutamyl/glutaminyl-tRNA synthetase